MRRKVLIFAIAAVLLVPLPGCDSVGARCEVTSNSPHQSKGTPNDMVGKARFACVAAVDSVTVDVKIQELRAGKWVDVAAADRETVPTPIVGKKYTTQAVMECSAGTFRTASRGHADYQGRRSRPTPWGYSPSVTDPCG